MLNRLTIVVLETTLCIFRMVDAAKRELARDYPKMRGTSPSIAHAWRDAER